MIETQNAVEPVHEWAMNFLLESGALVNTDFSSRRVEILIPEPLAERLGTDFVNIPLEQSADRTSDPLTPGSQLLNCLIEQSLTKGRTAQRHLWAAIKKTLTLEDITRKIAFHGARPRDIAARFVYVPHVLFHFLVSYISDDKQEEIVPAFIHPFLNRVLPFAPYESAMPGHGNELNLEELPLPSVDVIYEAAKADMPFLIEKRMTVYHEREQKRFNREAQRVKSYFLSIRKDLARRLSREGLAAEKKTALSAKIQILHVEEKRKLADLEKKHCLLVQAGLVNAALIYVPQILAEVSIERRGLEEAGTLTVFWDPILKETLIPACPVCRQEMVRVSVCPYCRRAVCPEDAGKCR
ncbi:MAG: hypothetical protein ABIG11_05475 [bacterium]